MREFRTSEQRSIFVATINKKKINKNSCPILDTEISSHMFQERIARNDATNIKNGRNFIRMKEYKVSINFLRLKDIISNGGIQFAEESRRIERIEKKKNICKFEHAIRQRGWTRSVTSLDEPAEAILICHWPPDQIFLARSLRSDPARLCTRRGLR